MPAIIYKGYSAPHCNSSVHCFTLGSNPSSYLDMWGREVGGLCTRYVVFSYVDFYNQRSLKQEVIKLHSKQ